MAAICYSGPTLAVSTKEQLLVANRMFAKIQSDIVYRQTVIFLDMHVFYGDPITFPSGC